MVSQHLRAVRVSSPRPRSSRRQCFRMLIIFPSKLSFDESGDGLGGIFDLCFCLRAAVVDPALITRCLRWS